MSVHMHKVTTGISLHTTWEAVISLSVWGVREKPEQDVSSRRGEGLRRWDTCGKEKRASNNDGDLSLSSVGRRCTGESHEKRQRLEFFPEVLSGLKKEAHWNKASLWTLTPCFLKHAPHNYLVVQSHTQILQFSFKVTVISALFSLFLCTWGPSPILSAPGSQGFALTGSRTSN